MHIDSISSEVPLPPVFMDNFVSNAHSIIQGVKKGLMISLESNFCTSARSIMQVAFKVLNTEIQ